MSFVLILSDLVIPVIFVLVILHGISKKVKIYDIFVEGAKEGINTVIMIFPTLLGLLVAVGVLRASGALDMISYYLSYFTDKVKFPSEVVPLILTRLFSASAARGLMIDIFENFGPDSFIGRLSSILMSCTETVFYTMSIYFMSIKITNTKYTLFGALLANFFGILASFYITIYIFGK